MTEVLRLLAVSKQYGVKSILNDCNLSLSRGERFALVGENGAGKTTLARLIIGQESPDSGVIQVAQNVVIGYLPQEVTTETPVTIAQYIAQAVGDLHTISEQMATLEKALEQHATPELLEAYGTLQDDYQARGGYTLAYRTEQIFSGLGISHLDDTRWIHTLSGGERTRVHLATLLLQAPDLLILDEPTNHLDFEGVAWLELYLARYPQALLLITHDRTFINRVATHIVELNATTKQLVSYHGNYEAYLSQRAQTHEKALGAFLAQREEVAQLKRLVTTATHNPKKTPKPLDGDKFLRYKMEQTAQQTRSKRIRDAKQRLEVLAEEKLSKPSTLWQVAFEFNPLPLISPEPFIVEGLSKAFNQHFLLKEAHFSLKKGARVVLVAPNGTGKSTLLKLLIGNLEADSGKISIAPNVKLGYLDQDGDTLNPEQGVLESYRAVSTHPMTDEDILTELHRSGLFHDASLARKRVQELSVGQRRKLSLARLIASQANVLLLDEPTNHLDLMSVEALEASLMTFKGAILAVSHDRRFVEKVATEVWHLQAGQLVQGMLNGHPK